jgi:glutamyl-tRNA reductase
MDDLNRICEQNRHARVTSARAAEKYIAEWTHHFGAWQRERRAVPRIRHFRGQAESVRLAEVQRTLKALPELNGHQRAAIERLSRSLSQKLLHEPTVWLREHGEEPRPHAGIEMLRDKEILQ